MPDILTTHVGSLPRGDELAPLLLARDHGEPCDAAVFDRIVQAAVIDAVARQESCGVSIVSDGELGKVGYSTYVTDRLSGFGGNVARKPALDLAALPQLRKKLVAIMGEQEFVRSSCVGPVKLRNLQPCLDDIRRFRQAMQGRKVRGFMNAASPGLITAFQPNAFYPSHEAYLADLVAAMQPEFEAIATSGFQLQLDCPDLAMSRHTGYQDKTEEQFLKIAAANVEALNAATAGIAPRSCECMSVGATTKVHTISTYRWNESSTSFCGRDRRRFCSKQQTPGTSTSGRSGRRQAFPTTKCLHPV